MVHLQGLEPWTHWLRVSCSTNWARGAYYISALNGLHYTSFKWICQVFYQKIFRLGEICRNEAKQAREMKTYTNTSIRPSRSFNEVPENLSKQNKKSGLCQTPIYKFCEEKFRKTRQSKQTKWSRSDLRRFECVDALTQYCGIYQSKNVHWKPNEEENEAQTYAELHSKQ